MYKKTENRTEISDFNIKKLIITTKKSKLAMLAEKYLTLSLASEENKAILKSLKKEKRQKKLF